MSQDTAATDVPPTQPGNSHELPDRVYLVSYPKIVYLYPTVLTALFCGIFMWAKGGIPQEEIRLSAVRSQVVANSTGAASSTGVVNSTQVKEKDAVSYAKAAVNFYDETPVTPATGTAAPADATTPEVAPPSEQPTSTGETAAEPSKEAVNPGSDAATADGGDAQPVAEDAKVQLHTYHNICARVFLLVMALNLVVIAFDFPRTTSLTWFFAIVSIVIGLWFVLTLNSWLAPQIVTALLKIKPAANATFYLIFASIMIFLYLCVLISRRFDYWEVKGNELLHHHGFLSNLERFSAPNLRIDKEINDVFEYLLLRSGRLIIHASNERRAIVLENVLFINKKEERITKMLGALQVRVRTERDS